MCPSLSYTILCVRSFEAQYINMFKYYYTVRVIFAVAILLRAICGGGQFMDWPAQTVDPRFAQSRVRRHKLKGQAQRNHREGLPFIPCCSSINF